MGTGLPQYLRRREEGKKCGVSKREEMVMLLAIVTRICANPNHQKTTEHQKNHQHKHKA